MRSEAFVAKPFAFDFFIFVMIARSQRLQSPNTPRKSMRTHSTRKHAKALQPSSPAHSLLVAIKIWSSDIASCPCKNTTKLMYKNCQTVQTGVDLKSLKDSLKVMVLFISPGFTSSLSSPRHKRCTKAADLKGASPDFTKKSKHFSKWQWLPTRSQLLPKDALQLDQGNLVVSKLHQISSILSAAINQNQTVETYLPQNTSANVINVTIHVIILSFPPFVIPHLVPTPSTHSQQKPLRNLKKNNVFQEPLDPAVKSSEVFVQAYLQDRASAQDGVGVVKMWRWTMMEKCLDHQNGHHEWLLSNLWQVQANQVSKLSSQPSILYQAFVDWKCSCL